MTTRRLLRAAVAAPFLIAACARSPYSTTSAPIASAPRVTIDAGTLEGRNDPASGALVFEGIPYAAPPVGDLRWRAPQSVASWAGVLAANRPRNNCMQHQPYGDIDAKAIGISEDCLYLNVWTPSTAGTHPVMVWIHGGGFFAGFGPEERHNPGPLAKKGAVVVTLNYRLGPFGFMAHPALSGESPTHSSGNYGMLDQIAALKWVQRNIARFGGDPANVTVFGESAGAISVGMLMASPLAKGLFAHGILQSGTGTVAVASLIEGEAIGVRVAETMGVVGADAGAAARLRAVPAEAVIAASVRSQQNPGSPIMFPVIDGYFLPHPVDSAIALGVANPVPIIVGTNVNEAESYFGAPGRSLARLLSARGVPVYLYRFTRTGTDSAGKFVPANHSYDITFAFGRAHPFLPFIGSAPYDATLADAISDYWVAFARSGDPNGPPAAGKWPHWPKYDPSADVWMELGEHIRAVENPRRVAYDSLDVQGRSQGQIRP
jgi:para-nitrobenzyl esterase